MATSVNIVNKKTASASEKVSPARKGNVSSSKAVTKVENGEYREMISNLMEPSHPYLLPRTVPTSAGVIFHKPQLSIIKNLEQEPFSVMIIRPAVEETVTYSVLGTVGLPINTNPVKVPDFNDPKITTSMVTWAFPAPLVTTGGELIPDIVERDDSFIIEADGSALFNATALYDTLQWPVGATIAFTVTVLNKAGGVLNGRLTIKDELGANLEASAVLTSSGSIFNGVLTTTTANATAGRKTIAFVVSTVGAEIQPKQFEISVTGFSVPGGETLTKTLSLWEMLGNVTGSETSREQYYHAERYSITGFSALLRNTTASQYKSGSIVAAQLPGGSEHLVPGDPETAYRFIASYNDPKTHSGQLNKGLHWFFSPEKVQDWFFRPTEDNLGERPFLAVAWSGVAANDLANMLGLTLDLRINIELLTTDISLMKFMPSPDLSRLFDLYITMVNAHNSVGENPDHKAKIRKIVQSIMSSPYTKAALKAAIAAGKVVVPLALAAM